MAPGGEARSPPRVCGLPEWAGRTLGAEPAARGFAHPPGSRYTCPAGGQGPTRGPRRLVSSCSGETSPTGRGRARLCGRGGAGRGGGAGPGPGRVAGRGSPRAAGGGGAAGHSPRVELVNDAFEANDGEEARAEAGQPGQEKDGEGEQRLPAGRLRQTPGQPRRGRLRRRHAACRLVRALGPGPVVAVPAVPQSHEAAPRGRVEGRLVLALRGRGLRHVVPRRRVSLLAAAAAAAPGARGAGRGPEEEEEKEEEEKGGGKSATRSRPQRREAGELGVEVAVGSLRLRSGRDRRSLNSDGPSAPLAIRIPSEAAAAAKADGTRAPEKEQEQTEAVPRIGTAMTFSLTLTARPAERSRRRNPLEPGRSSGNL